MWVFLKSIDFDAAHVVLEFPFYKFIFCSTYSTFSNVF